MTDELGMCANFDPPHLSKRAAHVLDKDGIHMQGELSYGVVQELHKYCSEPKPHSPPYPEDKQEVEAAFDLLKALAAVGEAALDNSALPPPPPHPCRPRLHSTGHNICPISRWHLQHNASPNNCSAAHL